MGQRRSLADVARKAGLQESGLESLERGERPPTASEVQALGEALGLRTPALIEIAINGWNPQPLPEWAEREEPIIAVAGEIGGYPVKGYILFDPAEKNALMIDTAYHPAEMIAQVRQRGLRLTGICLTHGHIDHAGELEPIVEQWPVPVYLGAGDRDLLRWKPPKGLLTVLSPGQEISVGSLRIICLATPGHTPGGFSYRLSSAGRNFCFVGDTLFAGSIGRSNPPSLYPLHLDSVREKLLTLPVDTVLLPGHGPATTVREELDHNPFA